MRERSLRAPLRRSHLFFGTVFTFSLGASFDDSKEEPCVEREGAGSKSKSMPIARVICRSLTLVITLAGCASTTAEPAKAPTSEPSAAAKAPAAGAKSAKPAEKTAAATPAASEEPDPRADGLRKASRPPAELITGPNLVYVFNFKESEVGQEAQSHCSEQNSDPGALGACLTKARGKVPVELIRFIKEPSGELWWVTYNRYKGNLLKWHRVQFQPGQETADRITLNLIGEDKGIAPMARVPHHLEIELPNDYSIVVKDPEHGDMMYDAKIGTMED